MDIHTQNTFDINKVEEVLKNQQYRLLLQIKLIFLPPCSLKHKQGPLLSSVQLLKLHLTVCLRQHPVSSWTLR